MFENFKKAISDANKQSNNAKEKIEAQNNNKQSEKEAKENLQTLISEDAKRVKSKLKVPITEGCSILVSRTRKLEPAILVILNEDAIITNIPVSIAYVANFPAHNYLQMSSYSALEFGMILPNNNVQNYINYINKGLEDIIIDLRCLRRSDVTADCRDITISRFEQVLGTYVKDYITTPTQDGSIRYVIMFNHVEIARYRIGPRGGIYVETKDSEYTKEGKIKRYSNQEIEHSIHLQSAKLLFPQYSIELEDFYNAIYNDKKAIRTEHVSMSLRSGAIIESRDQGVAIKEERYSGQIYVDGNMPIDNLPLTSSITEKDKYTVVNHLQTFIKVL